LRGASWILIVTLALSNLLGVIRDHFLAQKIPTDQLDIYYAAFRLPDLLFNVLILGATSAAVIPILSRTFKEGSAKAWRLVNNLLCTGLGILILALVVLYFLLPYILPWIVPDFPINKLETTIGLARWMLLSPLFFAISYIWGSILNSKKRFLSYALAPLFYNFSIILFTVFGVNSWGVAAPVIGVIAGALLHMLSQLPAVLSLGFRPKIIVDIKDKNILRIFRLMVPRAIALGASQIQLLAFTAFASAIPGAIAIYSLTDNIQTVPTVIFGISLATAVFPSLANLGDVQNKKKFVNLVTKVAKAVLFLLIPAAVGMLLLRAQIVRLILGYGYFGWADTKMASDTLALFAVGIVAQGLIPLLARAYYAIENTRFPMKSAVVSVAVGVVVGYFALQKLGVSGLGLAFALAGWTQLFILLWGLEAQISFRLTWAFWKEIAQMIFLSLTMALLMQLVKMSFARYFDIDYVVILLTQTILAAGAGILWYLGVAWLLKMPQIRR